jgi:hypothetical protein
MATSVIAVLSLMYTANLGGKIRHPEIRSASLTQGSSDRGLQEKALEKEEDDE